MNDEQLLRYSRHILLDEIGIEGQQALREARVLVVGVGGLGSPVAIYLAASGVGHLTLVDDDSVDLSNLQRQILHGTADVGSTKVASAERALARLNPEVAVAPFPRRADAAALAALVANADVVVDCSDNFATRHAINRACVQAAKPLVSGAAVRFSGQVATFDLRATAADTSAQPCYACLFPEDAENDDVDCATFGVFAPLTGIVGATQAAEVVKLVVGLSTLAGRLLLFDAIDMTWQSITLPRDPACAVCRVARPA